MHFLPAVRHHGRAFHFKAALTCSDGDNFTGGPYIVDVEPRHGSFEATSTFQSNGFPAEAAVNGLISGHHASGTLRIAVTMYASSVPTGIHCSSGKVSWKATAAEARD